MYNATDNYNNETYIGSTVYSKNDIEIQYKKGLYASNLVHVQR
jgi:hypothetical protein